MRLSDDEKLVYVGSCGCCEYGVSVDSNDAHNEATESLANILRYCKATGSSLRNLRAELNMSRQAAGMRPL